MKNRLWILTAGIILVNFALVLFLRHSLPADLPLHINLDGTFAKTMPYTRLFFYPATSLVAGVLIYMVAAIAMKLFPKLDDARGVRCTLVDITACCLALIVLCSTCVALTMGQNHVFMFAEPLIFLVLLTAIIVGEVRIHRNKEIAQ